MNYPYNGPIYHKPQKSFNEFVVGKCVDGVRIIAPESTYSINSESEKREKSKSIKNSSVSHKTQRDPGMRLRFEVLKRDNFKCCACGASPAKDPSVELHVDHIVPWSKGGETVIDNLQTLCSKCNFGKGNME